MDVEDHQEPQQQHQQQQTAQDERQQAWVLYVNDSDFALWSICSGVYSFALIRSTSGLTECTFIENPNLLSMGNRGLYEAKVAKLTPHLISAQEETAQKQAELLAADERVVATKPKACSFFFKIVAIVLRW
jgi:hypothetical protein